MGASKCKRHAKVDLERTTHDSSQFKQIVSSHSEVLGAGELRYVSQLGLNLSVDPKAIKTSAISEFIQRYLSELSKLSNEKQFVTDKMPQNFYFFQTHPFQIYMFLDTSSHLHALRFSSIQRVSLSLNMLPI